MTGTGRLFVLALWAVGLATGLVLARAPDTLALLPSPALTVPLAVALVADLALRPAAASGRIAPLTMNDRAIAVIGAGLLAIGASALLAR